MAAAIPWQYSIGPEKPRLGKFILKLIGQRYQIGRLHTLTMQQNKQLPCN
jgi:hypothetical protein